VIASFFLALREGLEAALIIGVLLGTLKKLNHPQGRRLVWSGTLLAILASAITGVVLNLFGASFEGQAEMIFEGITMLLAAGILTWVILWMRTQSRVLNQKLESDVQQAALDHKGLALFSLSFLAVIREGIELAFFLTAVSLNAADSAVLIGAGLGLASVVVIAVLLLSSLIRLNLARFFQVTSLILILFAAGLVAHAVHEFNEVGFIPPLIEHLWDLNPILDENSTLGELLKATLGYNGNPSLMEVISYFSYFILLVGVVYLRGRKDLARSVG
jgi:high-affinity iron transporter